jgi:nitric-oxide synthase
LSPFSGWFQVTEIARNLLDSHRYNLAEAVAAACDIRKTQTSLWRDDAQLQVNKAIIHSFARNGVSCVDHHFASDSFLDFFSSELRKRGNCPGSLLFQKS